MNYESKYKEALSFLKDLKPHMSDYCIEKLEGCFPELKESEDERIKKMLIRIFKKADMGGEIFGECITYKQVIAWLEKQGKQKHDWSKEDENMREAVIDVLVNNTMSGSEGDKVYSEEIDWLKSIKPNHWKPSKEQMEALNALNNTAEISYIGQADLLIKLYNDLLKL